MLTWNFGGGLSDSTSTFFKMASAYNDFHAVTIIIGCEMLHNENVMAEKASEVVQKVPKGEKDYHKCFLCIIVSIEPQHIQ